MHIIAKKPKVGNIKDYKLLLISYFLPESFLLASSRILFLVSLLFCCIVNPFDPYSPLNFNFFIIPSFMDNAWITSLYILNYLPYDFLFTKASAGHLFKIDMYSYTLN